MVNSGILDGLTVEDAKKKIIDYLSEKGIAKPKVNFKLRDWVFDKLIGDIDGTDVWLIQTEDQYGLQIIFC